MDFQSAASFIEAASVEILTNLSNGIVGLAIGRKHGGPISLGGTEYCITVFVVRKFSPPLLNARQIPDAYDLCNQASTRLLLRPLDPQDVNVIETGDIFRLQATYNGSSHANPPAANTQKWFVKVRPGIGIANPTDTYPDRLVGGTCGFFAKRSDGTVYLVSCNHVIAREKTSETPAPLGQATLGEAVVQPATMDLPGSDISRLNFVELTRDYRIATLSAVVEVDVYMPGNPNPPFNYVDAALAEVAGDRSDQANFSRLPYGGRLLGEHEYRLNDVQEIDGSPFVFKCGRTTGYTEGEVTDVKGRIPMDFAGKKALFVDQLIMRPTPDSTGCFSDSGDSGSPVITDEHKLIGILIGGTPTRSVVSPINTVLSTLALATDASGVAIGSLSLVL